MKSKRRYDIDWIRVIVFDILIIFHVGMFFNTWDWHIKNNQQLEWLKYPMFFTSEWRIPILFVISGIGTKFALSFRSANDYIKERFSRLLLPFVVGVLVTVAPQVYFERLAEKSFDGSFIEFYPNFFNGIYPNGNLSWHHLWFLPYLLLMSVLATPLFMILRKKGNNLVVWLRKLFEKSVWSIYIFLVPLFLTEFSLHPYFPTTHALWGDWYALLFYFVLFISGFILICIGEPFWKAVCQLRWAALFIGIVAFSTLLMMIAYDFGFSSVEKVVKMLNMWSWIVCIFGFAGQFLNKESQIIKKRNEVVYPFYILHQSITIIIGFYLMNSSMSILIKFMIMTLGTFGGSWILTEIIKKIKVLRPLFGLKNR